MLVTKNYAFSLCLQSALLKKKSRWKWRSRNLNSFGAKRQTHDKRAALIYNYAVWDTSADSLRRVITWLMDRMYFFSSRVKPEGLLTDFAILRWIHIIDCTTGVFEDITLAARQTCCLLPLVCRDCLRKINSRNRDTQWVNSKTRRPQSIIDQMLRISLCFLFKAALGHLAKATSEGKLISGIYVYAASTSERKTSQQASICNLQKCEASLPCPYTSLWAHI